MGHRLGTSHSLIGVDLERASIRAVQLRGSGENARLSALALIEREDPSVPIGTRDLQRLAGVLQKRGFKGRRVVIGATQIALRREILTLPPLGSGAPVDQIARAELARTADVDPRNLELAMWELPRPSRASEGVAMLVASYAHADAQHLLDLLDSANLEGAAIDLPCWAIARACEPLLERSKTTAVMDLAWDTSTLSIIQDGTVIHDRVLTGGSLGGLTAAVAEHLDVETPLAWRAVRQVHTARESVDPLVARIVDPLVRSHIDALTQEMRASFTFVQHRYKSDHQVRLLLAGEPLALAERLGAALELEASDLVSSDLVEKAPGVGQSEPTSALTRAIGYARWEEAA